ncbi:MAG: carboxymuconolactone decarboxylase family protein [Legionellales bacterium]|nr:carboxymuconolactone decarboxylase family protein [Legionellales bacterium]
MAKDYPQLTKELMGLLTKLQKQIPETLTGFNSLMTGATKDGALDKKTKELIALGIAVAARCDGCIGFHVQKLVQMQIDEKAFMETLAMAIYMGGGPSLMYALEALRAFEQFQQIQ